MGSTYSNCQVRGSSQEAVVTALRGLLKEPAYVSPSVGGWVGVYPEGGSTDSDVLAERLSERLAASVFSWQVYDSDVFFYSLYESGRLSDQFNSSPGYFEAMGAEGDDETEPERMDPAQVRGDPKALLPFCISGTTAAAIQDVLHPAELAEPDAEAAAPPTGFARAHFPLLAEMLGTTEEVLTQGIARKMRKKYIFAQHQASDLARLLGTNEELETADYRSIEQEQLEGFSKENFYAVGKDNLSQEYKNKKLWSSFQVESLKSAIEAGAEINARDAQGVPLLVRVARYCANETVEFLISAGADVNAATFSVKDDPTLSRCLEMGVADVWEGGVTPLFAATSSSIEHLTRQLETVRLLLNAGADVNARSEMGRTPLSAALKMTDPAQHQRKIGRIAPEDVLRAAALRSAQVAEILRAVGATE